MSPTRSVRLALLISSHRRDGNTEQLAERALQHLPVAAEIDRIRLFDYRIERFPDVRHHGRVLPDYKGGSLVGYGSRPGDVLQDAVGLAGARTLTHRETS